MARSLSINWRLARAAHAEPLSRWSSVRSKPRESNSSMKTAEEPASDCEKRNARPQTAADLAVYTMWRLWKSGIQYIAKNGNGPTKVELCLRNSGNEQLRRSTHNADTSCEWLAWILHSRRQSYLATHLPLVPFQQRQRTQHCCEVQWMLGLQPATSFSFVPRGAAFFSFSASRLSQSAKGVGRPSVDSIDRSPIQ